MGQSWYLAISDLVVVGVLIPLTILLPFMPCQPGI